MYIHKKASLGDELKQAYQFIDNIFGPGITPFREVEKMQAKNPEFIHAIFNQASGDIIGYFSLIPLNRRAALKVSQNLLHGADIKQQDMTSPMEYPAAYYLGAVAALPDPSSRQSTMRCLLRYIKPLIDSGIELYTRPITEDGHRLCQKKGFVPVVEKPDAKGRLIYKMV